jgi:uncharacterized membrane protein YgcG
MSDFAPPPGPQNQPLELFDVLLLVTGGVAFWSLAMLPHEQMRGPAFLVYFAVLWLSLMLIQALLRWLWRDAYGISVIAALVLGSVAFTRYRWGIEQGMTRWDFLFLMTILGCLLFFVRARDLRNNDGDGGSWWSGSSCGSSCGGGGCGGGGCGGCGG